MTALGASQQKGPDTGLNETPSGRGAAGRQTNGPRRAKQTPWGEFGFVHLKINATLLGIASEIQRSVAVGGVVTVPSCLKAFHTTPIENTRIPGKGWLLSVFIAMNDDNDSGRPGEKEHLISQSAND